MRAKFFKLLKRKPFKPLGVVYLYSKGWEKFIKGNKILPGWFEIPGSYNVWPYLDAIKIEEREGLRTPFLYKLKYLRLRWKHRDKDPAVCCCGGDLSEHTPYDSICQHGGCRSLKEYTITEELNK